jgi:DsbC/DsbD-like thiol-disulfide interchange protein
VTFTVADPEKFTAIDATVFIGVCQDVCIPVQTTLSVTPDPQAENNPAGAAIAAAYSRLPAQASAEIGVASFQLSGDQITAKVALPAFGATSADLFVVTPQGWVLGLRSRTRHPADIRSTLRDARQVGNDPNRCNTRLWRVTAP